ncbi:MAG TPA: M48 family metallopeptidase [Gammaproteobacteria bacterium]|nr:M48 family metallopeptidase [Gammaproteobacteria bacterium]
MKHLAALASAVLLLAFLLPAHAATTPTAAPAAASHAAAVDQQAPVPIPTPSPEAQRYYESGNVLWIVATLWGFIVPGLVLFTGLSAKLREWSRRAGKYWYPTLVLYLILFSLVTALLNLPLEYYATFVRPHDYGLSSQLFGKWVQDELIGLALGLLVGALVLWIPYLLLKKSPRRWWIYTWLASIPIMVFLAFVQPIWVEPLFNHFGPMQDKALETQILDLAHRAGIEGANVYEVNKSVDTNELNAYATGIGDTKRIVLWDTIVKQFTPDELLMVMGHEMGHYVLDHVWEGLAFASALLLLGLYLVHRTAGWVLRRFAAQTGVRELSDVASMPLLVLLFGLFFFILQPAEMAFSRHLEHEADRFGLEITHLNHACGTAFTKFVQHDLSYPTPGLLFKLWRSSHPPLAERIRFCNDYHPWTEGKGGKYWRYFKPLPAGKGH